MLWLAGCGRSVDCTDPSTPLYEAPGAPTCEVSQQVEGWIELIAARDIQPVERRNIQEALAERFKADPVEAAAWVERLLAAGRELEATEGMAGAVARSHAVWRAHGETGVIRPSDGAIWNVQRRALSVWAWNDDHELALTEADMEGWIYYAAWCREVQGGALRLSVADRVTVYRILQDRFNGGTEREQQAMASIGPFWGQIRDRWRAASYPRQQRWIAAAPLPPPMTATSLGYAEVVYNGPVSQHVQVVHEHLGPFSLNRRARVFLTP